MWLDSSSSWLLLPLYSAALILFHPSPPPSIETPSPACDPASDPIWPRPASMQPSGPDDGTYWRLQTSNLHLILDVNQSADDWSHVQEILNDAQRRYSTMIPALASARPPLAAVPSRLAGTTSRMRLAIRHANIQLSLQTSEEYEITINANDGVVIGADTVVGALRALQTLAQLAVQYGPGDLYLACVEIRDGPLYPYRGLMIDTGRHFLSVDLIGRILDGMELDKLNVLHWHLSDDQSFPFRSASNPDLSRAAFTPRLAYSPSDVRRLARRARMRGIRIVPEIDSPGHSASFGVGYPAVLARCPNVAPPSLYMINPVKDETRRLMSTLLQEAVDVFGDGDLIHLGGDEVDTDCLADSDEIKDYMKEHDITDPKQLLADYQTFLEHLSSHTLNRTAIVWQEVIIAFVSCFRICRSLILAHPGRCRSQQVFDSGLPMGPDTIVDVWYNPSGIANVLESGHRALLSSCWYLDHLGTDWRSMYDCDPGDYVDPERETAVTILGGHACMWGEKADDTNAIMRIWPRASTVGERLWSRRELVNDEGIRSRAEDRLHLHRCRMLSLGIAASPIRPGYCLFQ